MPGPRRPSIAILGLPYFGQLLAGQLRERGWRAQFIAHPGRNPRGWLRLAPKVLTADVLYLISSRVDRGSPQDLLLRIRRKPTVIHWVGTDALIAMDEWRKDHMASRMATKPIHWCDAPWLANELAPSGIRATHVALPIPFSSAEPPPLPAEFRVLCYLPLDAFDREVFDVETLCRLPAAHPNARFTFIPSPAGSLPPLPANVSMPGWISDMDALYAETTVMLRLTTHDGTSFMAVESLARGRHVIWPFPFPGVVQASGFPAVSAALARLEADHRAGALSLNQAGRAYVLEAFDPERLLRSLDGRLRRIVREDRRR